MHPFKLNTIRFKHIKLIVIKNIRPLAFSSSANAHPLHRYPSRCCSGRGLQRGSAIHIGQARRYIVFKERPDDMFHRLIHLFEHSSNKRLSKSIPKHIPHLPHLFNNVNCCCCLIKVILLAAFRLSLFLHTYHFVLNIFPLVALLARKLLLFECSLCVSFV